MERDNFPYIYWCPTDDNQLMKLIDFCQLTPNDTLMDLGCGDAKILIAAAKRIGCKCIGVETDKHMTELATKEVKKAGFDDLIEIRRANIFTADLSDATVYFAYLFYWMNKLIPVLNKSHSRRIITRHFHFQDSDEGHYRHPNDYKKSLKSPNRTMDFGDVREYLIPMPEFEVRPEFGKTKVR